MNINNNKCDNCKITFKKINKNIYFFENYYINKLLEKYKIECYLNKNIIKFLYPLNYNVFSERKSRNKKFDCDPDDYFIYQTKITKLCFKCFVVGIDRCLSLSNNLPYLRRDIYYFLNDNNKNIIKKHYKKYKYILPNNYNCTYYRNQELIKVNNKIKIKKY